MKKTAQYKIYKEICKELWINFYWYWWFAWKATCIVNWLHRTIRDFPIDDNYISNEENIYINVLWIDKDVEDRADNKYLKKKYWVKEYKIII